ncbi:MAG: hypothetical protein H3C35_07340 [Bacteroidetes bacterium]|nr:hypothetical protein [Bacteroidota bacterium]
MVFYLYIAITVIIALILLSELWKEKNWKQQLLIVIILLPLVLRILQIK